MRYERGEKDIPESAGYHSYQASYAPSIHSKPVCKIAVSQLSPSIPTQAAPSPLDTLGTVAVPVTDVTLVVLITPPAQLVLYETNSSLLGMVELILGPVLRT